MSLFSFDATYMYIACINIYYIQYICEQGYVDNAQCTVYLCATNLTITDITHLQTRTGHSWPKLLPADPWHAVCQDQGMC